MLSLRGDLRTARAPSRSCVKYARSERAQDPHWHNHGRQLETKCGIIYTFKAAIRNGAFFSKEIRGTQELVVNSFFDLNKLRPAHSENSGTVRLLCCIPRGKVTLTCDFDRAAYTGGDTAHIKAVIANESKSDVRSMKVKLVRVIDINDGSGHNRTFSDVVATAAYPGVPKGETQSRDLPLSFQGRPGDYLPSTRGRHVGVSYKFSVECDIAWAVSVGLPRMLLGGDVSRPVARESACTVHCRMHAALALHPCRPCSSTSRRNSELRSSSPHRRHGVAPPRARASQSCPSQRP